MRERGVVVSYESIHRWWHTFGPLYATEILRHPQPKDKWHLDEVRIVVNGAA